MTMRKLVLAALVLLMLAGLCSCGKSGTGAPDFRAMQDAFDIETEYCYLYYDEYDCV